MIRLRAAALSDIGRVRKENEDRTLFDEERRLFGVADGVGGLPGGGEAAQAAHDSVMAAFRALPLGAPADLEKIVEHANRAVAQVGRVISPSTGIATTLTFGFAHKGHLRIAHVGDSRCYLFQRDRLVRLTEDHTVENDARRFRFGDVIGYSSIDGRAITRCLGTPAANADMLNSPLAEGDRYLFCTDGITGPLSDPRIAAIVRRPDSPAAILQELIAEALRRGGTDNATAVLVMVDEA